MNPAEASLLISQSHVRFFSWGNPAEWVQMRTLTVEAVFESFFPCFQKHSHGSLLLLCVVLDKGIDSILWRVIGMVWYYIESRLSVFVYLVL